ncbi:DUF1559 family PulG-like putative transporter [Paludisphaera mucosa]|uniref:DUF1559 domain-containing protein n=1 Tax=Paludisphaera mucosa TaxID=3030827 RepID=A0ABT6FHC3_9BACT|nr:DUF1559 domain-containing protein [Paludisphaera mucosa]MDG3006972.1 DUF1559 domain-containing protein [Paludisphaera mucosa]
MISAPRRGFTLIECLVTVVVLGVLAGLMLAVVMRAREAARRTQCASHLHNVGLALHQHQEARGTFPSGAGSASFLWKILPFLEQEPLHKTLIDDRTAAIPLPGLYLCPSDSARTAPMSRFATNYAGNAGVFGREPVAAWDGVFSNEELTPRDVGDGLSHTAAVVEWIVGGGDVSRATRLGSIYIVDDAFPDSAAGLDDFAKACDASGPGGPWPAAVPFKGSYWFRGRLGHSLYTHALPPDHPSCRAAPDLNAITAGSLHGDGCNVLLLDGAVRFVRDTVNPSVWRGLGTRGGGEAIPGTAY